MAPTVSRPASPRRPGYGLVGSAVQNGLRLVVVVNGLKDAKERGEEAKKLLEWGFRSFEQRTLFAEGQAIGTARYSAARSATCGWVATGMVRVMLPKSAATGSSHGIVYNGPGRRRSSRARPIGSLKVWRNDAVILEMPLKASENVGKAHAAARLRCGDRIDDRSVPRRGPSGYDGITVIPGRRETASPESIFTDRGYGFRIRSLRPRLE